MNFNRPSTKTEAKHSKFETGFIFRKVEKEFLSLQRVQNTFWIMIRFSFEYEIKLDETIR